MESKTILFGNRVSTNIDHYTARKYNIGIELENSLNKQR